MLAFPDMAAIRLGYGRSPWAAPPGDPQGWVASVAAAAPDDRAFSIARHYRPYLQQSAELKKDAARNQDALDALRRELVGLGLKVPQIRIARAVDDPSGFGERLVQFWADHFTVTSSGLYEAIGAAAFVDEAIRPHLTGRFADLMFAAETHPRMVMYLDQFASIGPGSAYARRQPRRRGVNENLAREMIELHSLGVGADYGQRDVRQLALLLTGLTFRPGQDEASVFLPRRAEPGSFTVLGRTYARGDDLGAIRAVIADLAGHPATARHIATKLARHFVADDPPAGLVDRLAQAFLASDGDLPTLYRTLAEAPELAAHLRHKVRQPLDFMVTALRACGLRGQDILALDPQTVRNRLSGGLVLMGQKWGMPRGPDGWPEEGAAWATAQGLAGRLDWSLRLLPKLCPRRPDPRRVLATALSAGASPELAWAVPRAESPAEGLAVILASPDINRR